MSFVVYVDNAGDGGGGQASFFFTNFIPVSCFFFQLKIVKVAELVELL